MEQSPQKNLCVLRVSVVNLLFRSVKVNSITKPDPLSPREQRRNFTLGIINGAVFSVANIFIDNDMVVTWFLAQLSVSNFLIGLMGPMRMVLWYIPQIAVSSYMQRQPYKIPAYRAMAVVRVVMMLVMALAIALIPVHNSWLVGAIFAIFAIYSLATSVGSLAFMSMLDKVIPPARRGRFFGKRMLLGGIINLGASALVGFLLEVPAGLRFPLNISIIFIIAAVAMAISLGIWCFLTEPPDETVTEQRVSWIEQFRRGFDLLKANTTYRTYLATRMCIVLAQVAMPFYVVYAKDVLGISARMISLYLTARTGASILSNLFWGRIADQQGNRRLIRITSIIALLMPLAALGTGVLGRTVPGVVPVLSYVFTIVFVAQGAFRNGGGIAYINYLLDLAPSAQKPLYLGFTNTLMGVGMFTTALGGLIVDWVGFDTVMLIAAVLYALAIGMSLLMSEPRQHALAESANVS